MGKSALVTAVIGCHSSHMIGSLSYWLLISCDEIRGQCAIKHAVHALPGQTISGHCE